MYVCGDVKINSHRSITVWFCSFASRTTRVRIPVEPTFITHPKSRQTRARASAVMCIAVFGTGLESGMGWDWFG